LPPKVFKIRPIWIEFLRKFTIFLSPWSENGEQNAHEVFNLLEKPGNRGSRDRSLVEDSSGSAPAVGGYWPNGRVPPRFYGATMNHKETSVQPVPSGLTPRNLARADGRSCFVHDPGPA